MRTRLLFCALILAAPCCKAADIDGEQFIRTLKGTYIELFTQQACLSPGYAATWHGEAAKYIGEENADAAVHALVGGCLGTLIGDDAVAAYQASGTPKFCCSFTQGVKRMVFDGDTITGIDTDGSTLFSHRYRFVQADGEGNYVYETTDGNTDEFRYFCMRPDSPATTFHLEFRYGSDIGQLAQLTTGKYAFWMASAVRKGHPEEHTAAIRLFVGENLGATRQ